MPSQSIISVPLQAPPGAQSLIDFRPTASTLLHELFHLVNGHEMRPEGGEVYGLANLLELSPSRACGNPESYVWVAVAYDYTKAILPDQNGNYVEFFTGYATQG